MKSKQIIKGKHNNLSVCDEISTNKNLIVTFLFTPSMKDTVNHYHIDLSLKEVKVLTK